MRLLLPYLLVLTTPALAQQSPTGSSRTATIHLASASLASLDRTNGFGRYHFGDNSHKFPDLKLFFDDGAVKTYTCPQ